MRDQMIRTSFAAAALSLALPAAPAAAQSVFTALARAGVDGGACTVANPCRTLSYALSQTSPNGRVTCLDSSIYGTATITRSVTIDCTETSATTTNLVIDDSASGAPGTINVVLRGLSVSAVTAQDGIRFVLGNSLSLERVSVTSSGGTGIRFEPQLAARLQIANSTIQNNGGASGTGIYVRPLFAGYASVTLDNVQIVGNPSGLFVDTRDSTGSSTNVVVNRSVVSGGLFGIAVEAPSGRPGAGVTVTGSTINGNASAGISANGALAQIRVGTTTIAGNSTGVQQTAGAIIASYGNNTLIGNGVNGTFNGFPTEN